MKYLIPILLFIVSCVSCSHSADRIEECFTLKVRFDIQHEVMLAAEPGEVEELFEECFIHVKSRMAEVGINLVLESVVFWEEPDSFSYATNSVTRIIENLDLAWTEDQDFLHFVLGRLWGKSWWECGPYYNAYCVFALESTSESKAWNKYFWSHTIGHLVGASHDTEECFMMNSYCPETGIIPHNAPWSTNSKRDILECMYWWCTESKN